MKLVHCQGSTSLFFRPAPGVILKIPRQEWAGQTYPERIEEVDKAFSIEKQILERLGEHPRIVPYRRQGDDPGIMFDEANCGSLQAYIDEKNAFLDDPLRWKWCLQATEAIAHLHANGVIHSDLRPENYLVNATNPSSGGEASLDLWLCDFGGSTCEEMGLDGGHLPDDPFFDPRLPWESTPAIDIFSLGSIFHTILTGYWPYRTSPPPSDESKFEYQTEVNTLFEQGRFPNLSKLTGGKVIQGCWNHQYATAEEVLMAVKAEMAALEM